MSKNSLNHAAALNALRDARVATQAAMVSVADAFDTRLPRAERKRRLEAPMAELNRAIATLEAAEQGREG